MSAFINKLGELRNGILVSASMVYILGYMIWAFHAWISNLGLLPLIDSQYFIAGILPAAVLVIVFWAVVNTRRFVDFTAAFLDPSRGGWRSPLSKAVSTIFYVSPVVFIVAGKIEDLESISDEVRAIADRVSIIAVFVFLFSSFLYPRSPLPARAHRYFFIGYFIFVGLALGIAVSLSLPGWLPQEFGGTRERCGVIAVARTDLPVDLSKEIFISNSPGTETEAAVMQSNRLHVLYSGSHLLFRQPGDDSKTYELPRRIVKGITWSAC